MVHPYKFYNRLDNFHLKQKGLWNYGFALSLHIKLEKMEIFVILSSPIHEYIISLHLFRSPLIPLNIIIVSVKGFYISLIFIIPTHLMFFDIINSNLKSFCLSVAIILKTPLIFLNRILPNFQNSVINYFICRLFWICYT